MDIMRMGKNPNYMGSWDLDDLPNREITLTIERIVDEEVFTNGQKENCTACYWTDKAYKPMILNVTNKKAICKLYKTKDTEKLKGKSVIIGTEQVKAFGGVHDALRIRPRIPREISGLRQNASNAERTSARRAVCRRSKQPHIQKRNMGKAYALIARRQRRGECSDDLNKT